MSLSPHSEEAWHRDAPPTRCVLLLCSVGHGGSDFATERQSYRARLLPVQAPVARPLSDLSSGAGPVWGRAGSGGG